MKKLLSIVTLGVLSLTSATSVFAGEYDLTQKVDKAGGFLRVSNITLVIGADAVPSTSNIVSKEVSGMSPELDTTKYGIESKYVKMSLQDAAGKEIPFAKPVTVSIEVTKQLKSPAILFSTASGTVEIPSEYSADTNTIMAENVADLNGVIAVAEKLNGASSTTSTTTTSTTTSSGNTSSGNTSSGTTIPGLETASNSQVTALSSSGSTQTGSTMSGATTVDTAMANAQNVQSREKGSSVYVALLVLAISLSSASFFLYRKI